MLNDDAIESPRAEWYVIAMIVAVVAYLRVRVGSETIGVEATTGLLALVVTVVRCALFRHGATFGATRYREALARVARRITLPLLVAFPAAVAASGSWREIFAGHSQNVNLWIGALAYVLALLELTQLRVWQLHTTTLHPHDHAIRRH
jgi:hypothetical protein